MISNIKNYLAIGVLASVAAVVAIEEIRLAAAKEDLADLQTEFADYKLNAQTLQRDALAKAAKETERRLEAQRSIINAKDETIEKLRTDFGNANAISERLRQRIKQLSRTNSNYQSTNSTPTGNSETKSPTERIGNLATMVDEAAGTLARELDEAIARGKACEVMYESLTE
jgi:chromosome segregation ATPase